MTSEDPRGDLTREYYEAVRDCTPEDCGDCILRPATNRACYTVDVDPGKEARMILGLMDERDALRARVAELEAENARIIQEWAISEAAARGGAPRPDTELRGIFAERDRLREALERIQTMTVLEWQGTARGCYIIAGKVKNQPPDLTAGEFNRGE